MAINGTFSLGRFPDVMGHSCVMYIPVYYKMTSSPHPTTRTRGGLIVLAVKKFLGVFRTSRWRPHKVDKRMVLEYTHGLFIT